MGTGRPYVAVVGAGVADDDEASVAEEVGELLARRGAVVVCGGMTGVMESVCKGAKRAGGTTVGILPGSLRSEANEYVDVVIATGLGEVRNALIVRTADVVVAIGGEYGTLSEIALALKVGTPVVGLDTWELGRTGAPVDAFRLASSPQEAADAAERLWAR
jgi:uncharacterized protein (TIGR00725 family)